MNRKIRVSVVVPTYQRRETVVRSVEALFRQRFAGGFEVIVVVDGSTDGTAEALRRLDPPFPLRVIEQANAGAASARNHGAQAASGELLLFIDDDMEAHPEMIHWHDRRHSQGADVVMGDIPLHPDSPVNLLSRGVGRWAEKRRERLADPDAKLELDDFLTGQISITRRLFAEVGGFDTNFTRDGAFGNEDVDFGYRLLRDGYRLAFEPKAVSWQRYVVTPERFLKQWRQAGSADVAFVRKHPGLISRIFPPEKCDRPRNKRFWIPAARAPRATAPFRAVLRKAAVSRVGRGFLDGRTKRLMEEARWSEYWQGVYEAGGIPAGESVVALAYHSIAEPQREGVLADYAVSPERFARQIDLMRAAGCRFVSGAELAAFLAGEGRLPRRAVLITFDDCYRDLLENALPVLKNANVPALAFAVSGHIGGRNEWDRTHGGGTAPLLDRDGLLELERNGIEIGAHSRTHPVLSRMDAVELEKEIGGSVEDLAALGLRRPRFFAYPYGKFDERCETAAARVGIRGAFTVRSGVIGRNISAMALRRVEVLRTDSSIGLAAKIVRAHLGERRRRMETMKTTAAYSR